MILKVLSDGSLAENGYSITDTKWFVILASYNFIHIAVSNSPGSGLIAEFRNNARYQLRQVYKKSF